MTSEISDYASFLSDQSKTDIVALHTFMMLYQHNDGAVHAFFEGDEDKPYYLPAIRQRAGQRQIHPYYCGGKINVISARELIKTRYKAVDGCMFFIDRDYDSYIGNQPEIDEYTYITDGYSIESDLVSNISTEVLLTDIVGISQADAHFRPILEAVDRAISQFAMLMKPFSALCLAAKSAGCKPNFNNVRLDHVFELDASGNIRKKPGACREFVLKITSNGKSVPFIFIVNWRRVICKQEYKFWIRGKYLLWIFQKSLLFSLSYYSALRRTMGLRAFRVPSALRENGLFDLLGGRLPKPKTLDEFLDRRLVV